MKKRSLLIVELILMVVCVLACAENSISDEVIECSSKQENNVEKQILDIQSELVTMEVKKEEIEEELVDIKINNDDIEKELSALILDGEFFDADSEIKEIDFLQLEKKKTADNGVLEFSVEGVRSFDIDEIVYMIVSYEFKNISQRTLEYSPYISIDGPFAFGAYLNIKTTIETDGERVEAEENHLYSTLEPGESVIAKSTFRVSRDMIGSDWYIVAETGDEESVMFIPFDGVPEYHDAYGKKKNQEETVPETTEEKVLGKDLVSGTYTLFDKQNNNISIATVLEDELGLYVEINALYPDGSSLGNLNIYVEEISPGCYINYDNNNGEGIVMLEISNDGFNLRIDPQIGAETPLTDITGRYIFSSN